MHPTGTSSYSTASLAYFRASFIKLSISYFENFSGYIMNYILINDFVKRGDLDCDMIFQQINKIDRTHTM